MLRIVSHCSDAQTGIHLDKVERRKIKTLTGIDKSRFHDDQQLKDFTQACLSDYPGHTAEERLLKHLIQITLKK